MMRSSAVKVAKVACECRLLLTGCQDDLFGSIQRVRHADQALSISVLRLPAWINRNVHAGLEISVQSTIYTVSAISEMSLPTFRESGELQNLTSSSSIPWLCLLIGALKLR
jgi:hypothetical protein